MEVSGKFDASAALLPEKLPIPMGYGVKVKVSL
jgi:hypothetical protein